MSQRGFNKVWNVEASWLGPGVFLPNWKNIDEYLEADEDAATGAVSDAKKIVPVVKPKPEKPVLRYPVHASRSKKLENYALSKLQGRKVLMPSKKKIRRSRLIPLDVVSACEEFRVLQDGEEWERVKLAMEERRNGSDQHFDVCEEDEVRVGPYVLCTKCADLKKRPINPADAQYGKGSFQSDATMYQLWRSSLLELQPYLEERERLERKKEKRVLKNWFRVQIDDHDSEQKEEELRHAHLNFDEAYELLTEAMTRIETSSNKTRTRLISATNSGRKFIRQASKSVSTIDEENESHD